MPQGEPLAPILRDRRGGTPVDCYPPVTRLEGATLSPPKEMVRRELPGIESQFWEKALVSPLLILHPELPILGLERHQLQI